MSLKRSPKHGLSHSFILRKSVMCFRTITMFILSYHWFHAGIWSLKALLIPFHDSALSHLLPSHELVQLAHTTVVTFFFKNHLVQSWDIKNHNLTRCRGRRSNSGPQDPREPSKAFTRVCSGGTLFARGRLYPLFIWATFASMPSCTLPFLVLLLTIRGDQSPNTTSFLNKI